MALPFVTKEQLKKNGGGGGGGASAALLAPAWEPGEQYYIGDVVSKGNGLYICISDNSSYSWNDGYWEPTTITDSVLGLLNTEL